MEYIDQYILIVYYVVRNIENIIYKNVSNGLCKYYGDIKIILL